MNKLSLTVSLAMVMVSSLLACGSKGGDTTGSGGSATSSSASSSTSGSTASSTTGSGGSGGTGGAVPILCVTDGTCDFGATEDCTCADCATNPHCGGCVADQACTQKDDACTCKDCWADEFCVDTTNCETDGVCEQYFEGCGCADCAAAPNCVGFMP